MATKWKWSSGIDITLNDDYSRTFDLTDIAAGRIRYHTLNVKVDGELVVYTTSSTKDTYGWLTDGSCSLSTGNGSGALTGGTVYIKNDDGGSGSNFKYSYDLEEGEDYEIDYHNYYQDEDLEAVDLYIKFYADAVSSTTYTYDCYDLTSGSYLDKEAETTASSITRPKMSNYSYLGYVYHSSWSNCVNQGKDLDFDGTGTKCTGHSSKYPYIVFFYEQPTIYYKCYDVTTGTDMTSVSSKVTASSFNRPSKSGYKYLGYVYNADFDTCLSDYNSYGVDSTSTSYTPTASLPYVIFFYQVYEWTKTLISSMLTITSSISKSYSLNYSGTGVMAYMQVKPTIDGSLSVYTTGDTDTYGWLTNGNCSTVPGKNGSSALTGGVVYTKNDDSDSDTNFSYSYTTTPNTIYEIDVHNYSISGSGLVTTLNINFSPVSYSVTFNANNGSNAPNSISSYGTNQIWSCIIPNTAPTRSGYDFLGWSTSSSATIASYTPGSTVSFTGDIILYAIWKTSRPTFTWINKNLEEANLFTSYINTYLSGAIPYPLSENELIKASWYNAIADILEVANVSAGSQILNSQLKALEDAYNNK